MSAIAYDTAGTLLREWRQRRSLSQLALANEAQVSQRHLSFIESGRSAPSRSMIIRLADQLAIPLRERNALLAAAGFAPVYASRDVNDPELKSGSEAVDLILRGHEPYPAIAVDRHWNLLHANRAVPQLLCGADDELLKPPVNILRLALHPGGIAPRIENFEEWREHLLRRLSREIDNTADPALIELKDELRSYPSRRSGKTSRHETPSLGGIAVPLRLSSENGTLSLISTTTIFGTALDVGLSELTIESFFPADQETADLLKRSYADPE